MHNKESVMATAEKLKQLPDPNHIQLINGAEYIPIGIVEEYLDEIDSEWDVSDFKYDWYILPSGILTLSGSLQLTITESNEGHYWNKTTTGSCTLIITGEEENKDYVATLESYCISNAAKRMGKRFGRALNNRLKDGDTIDISSSTPAPSLTEEEAKSIPVNFKIPD